MASIQIREPAGAHSQASSSNFAGGVFRTRNLSGASLDRHSTWNKSKGKEQRSHPNKIEEEEGGVAKDDDYKKRQVFTGKTLLWLAYQSIGTIYGDIGTSPLYVYSSTFTSNPSYDDLVGVLSLIIWSLVMMVTVKYVLVVLHADNEGEGGTFSCYSLLSRYANITERDPREASMVKMERWKSEELGGSGKHMRSGMEKRPIVRGVLKVVGVLAVSMVIADGVLTPAQSVLGAVQGILVVNPDISKSTIVGTTCGILVLLFLVQPFGITKLASTFAPIVMIWLGFNAAFGIYNLVKYDWTVLKAFSPGFAFKFLIRNGEMGWRHLGGVLLCFTGVEALFADLGAFSMRAIQLSWLCYTLPCLLLAYIGQAAFISEHPSAYSNPFYNAAPPGTIYPSLIIAILAAIVASQAIITATFQLLAQVMKLSYFPQIKVVHTSKIFYGQIYIPMLNWLLMIGTVLVAAIYNNTTSLGNAYGVCVMFVTFFDTCMVSLVAVIVWRLSPLVVVLPFLTFALLDGTYLSSVLTKVPEGAWFTVALAILLASLFILWRFGKEQQWAAEAEDRYPTTHFVHSQPATNGSLVLTPRYGGAPLNMVDGFGIFFDKAGEMTPVVFSQFVRKLAAAPQVCVFFNLRPLETPSVEPERMYTVTKLPLPNCYRLVVRHGYNDQVITPDLGSLVYGRIRDYIVRRSGSDGHNEDTSDSIDHEVPIPGVSNENHEEDGVHQGIISSESIDDVNSTGAEALTEKNALNRKDRATTAVALPAPSPAEMLRTLDTAYTNQTVFIVGKEQMYVNASAGITRKVLLNAFLWLRENTRTKIASLRVDMEKTVEIGFVKRI